MVFWYLERNFFDRTFVSLNPNATFLQLFTLKHMISIEQYDPELELTVFNVLIAQKCDFKSESNVAVVFILIVELDLFNAEITHFVIVLLFPIKRRERFQLIADHHHLLSWCMKIPTTIAGGECAFENSSRRHSYRILQTQYRHKSMQLSTSFIINKKSFSIKNLDNNLETKHNIEPKLIYKLYHFVKMADKSITIKANIPKEVSIQYASDLHLEFVRIYTSEEINWQTIIRKEADILVLAGDICTLNDARLGLFLKWCKAQWRYVLYVPGNHEYYKSGMTIPESDLAMSKLCDENGIIFMQKDSIKLEGIIFVGCTLWTDINGFEREVKGHMNDFSHIKGMSIDIWKKAFSDHKEWLTNKFIELKEEKRPIVVITHHAPLSLGTSNKIYESRPTNHGFSTDLKELVGCANLWIFGHTHHSCTLFQDKTVVTSNCSGYPGEGTGYVPDKCVIFVPNKPLS